jgi:hypothetical protein
MKRIFKMFKTNLQSTQKSVLLLEEYLGTSEKYDFFSKDRLEYLEEFSY